MHRSILEKINAANPLHALTQAGLTPSEIKELIFQTLSPFFNDREIVRRLAVEFLAPEAANVGKLVNLPKGENFLWTVLERYRLAYKHDAKRCFEIISFWENRMEYASREFWSQALLEVPKEDLDLELFLHECLRNIGSLIEGSFQPLLRECLSLDKMLAGAHDAASAVQDLSLGTVVAQLQQTLPDPDLLAPEPWRIPINQWRNIAQHKSAFVQNGRIKATCGLSHAQKVVFFEREELLTALVGIQMRMSCLRSARTMFLFDHFDEAKACFPKIEVNAATKLFQLSSSFATQGFRLESVEINETETRFALRDISRQTDFKRIAHCSQFLVSIWLFYKTDRVTIHYLGADGSRKAQMFSTAAELSEVTRGDDIDWDCLSRAVHFEQLQKPYA